MPRGAWPSTNNTAPLGYAVAYLMDSKDCKAPAGRSQKSRSARSLQVKQLSMISSPYGDNTAQPPVTQAREACPLLPGNVAHDCVRHRLLLGAMYLLYRQAAALG